MRPPISPRRLVPAVLIVFILFTGAVGADTAQVLLRFKLFPRDASVEIDGETAVLFPGPEETRQCIAPPGPHEIRLSREGYHDALLFSSCSEEVNFIEEKLERIGSRLFLFASLETGSQPKSVLFSPDGRYIYAPLLDGPGIDVFRTADFTRLGRLFLPGKPPGIPTSDDKPADGSSPRGAAGKNVAAELQRSPSGFVESAAAPERGELWVSQMTTGQVHLFSLYGFRHIDSVDTGGEWSKVVRIDSKERYAYVSNWLSRDVSIIDMETRKLVGTVPVGGVPRGMEFGDDDRYLYVCLYEGGGIAKVDLEKRWVVDTLYTGESAPRHIVRDPATNRFYISDMLNGTVLVMDGDSDTLLKRIYVGSNPNTVDLTSDGKLLFVSTRGRNHPDGYLKKGLVFGKVICIDTESFEVVDWAWGGNQPTGLALSPDGRFLAFSDFLDDRIEVYYVDRD